MNKLKINGKLVGIAVIIIIVLFSINLLISKNVKAENGDHLNVEFVSRNQFGSAYDVFIEDEYAYVSAGHFLVIFNINENDPALVSYHEFKATAACISIFILDDYAYICNGKGLYIIDIKDKEHPVELGHYETQDFALDIFVSGNYAYLANYEEGLRIIDISDKENPIEVGFFNTSNLAYDVFVLENYAYIADYDDGLRIIDISIKETPVEVGYYDTYLAFNVYVVEDYAYIADHREGLRIINVSNKQNPEEVGYNDIGGDSVGVFVMDDYAYLAEKDDGFRIIDIENKENPIEIAKVQPMVYAKNIKVNGDFLYITDQDNGLRVFEIQDKKNPKEVGYYDTAGFAKRIVVKEDFAYIADGYDGLQIIDIKNISIPMKVSYFDTLGSVNDIFIGENFAYLAADHEGLIIVNITDKKNPIEEGYYDTPGKVKGIFVKEDYAFIADGDEGFRIINVSDKKNPVEEGSYKTNGGAYDIFVVDNYAYLADGDPGFKIFDVSDKSEPERLGGGGTYKALGIFISNNLAYIADQSKGIKIFDVSDKENPNEIGLYGVSDSAQDVYVLGDFAYVAEKRNGVRIIDISDPENPEEVGFYDTSEHSYGIYIRDDYVFVVDNRGGLVILDVSFFTHQPTAVIFANKTIVSREEIVEFNGSESFDGDGVIVEYYFDFGDEQNTGWIEETTVTHSYPNLGEYNVTLKVKDNDGNISKTKKLKIVVVNAPPISVLEANTTKIFKNQKIEFDASKSSDIDGEVKEYYFDFNDGNNSGWITNPIVEHEYTNKGDYYPTLKVKDNDGEESKIEKILIQVFNRDPIAILEANKTLVFRNEIIEFNASKSIDLDGEIVEYYFDFDDSSNTGWTINQSVEHAYLNLGNFNASLKVKDNDGNESELVKIEIIVSNIYLIAEIKANRTKINKGENITFNGSDSIDSDGTIIEYFFDFDDGSNSGWIGIHEIEHKFLNTGYYNISLKVKDNEGGESGSVEIKVQVLNRKPIALLEANKNIIYKNEEIEFNASNSTDSDGIVTEYFFDFDDDSTIGWITNSIIKHEYLNKGYYNITLKVKDNDNAESEKVQVQITVLNKEPIAVISASKEKCYTDEEVEFNTSGSIDNDGTVVGYYFDFDDDINSGWISSSLIQHAYNEIGYYNITLKVKDNDGAESENVRVQIIVKERPINKIPKAAIISINPNPVDEGISVEFIGSGEDIDGTIDSYFWNSSIDGDLSKKSTFSISNLSIGKHMIYFNVKDNNDTWSDEVSLELIINEVIKLLENQKPIPKIIANRTEILIGESVKFDLSNSTDPDGEIVGYFIDFGDGNNSGWINNTIIEYTYQKTGKFDVTLKVKDNNESVSNEDDIEILVKEKLIKNGVGKDDKNNISIIIILIAVVGISISVVFILKRMNTEKED